MSMPMGCSNGSPDATAGDLVEGVAALGLAYIAVQTGGLALAVLADMGEYGILTGYLMNASSVNIAGVVAIDASAAVATGAIVPPEVPTLTISSSRMPNIAKNIQSALDSGYPSMLTRETDPAIISANRSAACSGFCGEGSPDEYPFASTMEGGTGAQVQGVPLSEQRIQGGVLSQFYQQNEIGQGDQFQVTVEGLGFLSPDDLPPDELPPDD